MAARKPGLSHRAAPALRPSRDAESSPRVGWVARGSTPERLLVDWPDSPTGPIAARSVLALDAAAVARAAEERQPAVLLFEGGDPGLPILAGLVQSSTPLLDAVLGASASASVEPEDRRDGRRRVLEAGDELQLRCGKATITLRRNGKVVIRGAYLETHASGTNRIKGGTVKIN